MTITSVFEDLIERDSHIREKLLNKAESLPKLVLNARQSCDLELLLNGAFSPLKSFLTKQDYLSVRDHMRLSDGTLWPIPITLDVSKDQLDSLGIKLSNQTYTIVLVQAEFPERPLCLLDVHEVYSFDKHSEAKAVYNTLDTLHPAVHYLFTESRDLLIGGPIYAINLPIYEDYLDLRSTPTMLRQDFQRMGWNRIVAFQTRNPMHRAHLELTQRAATLVQAKLLIHPVVGLTKPGDIPYPIRVEAYQAILSKFPQNSCKLSLLPLAMRMGGPREVLLHAIIRKNYGCTHMIVGRDHAGPGKDSNGQLFYEPYEAQNMALKYEKELGISIVPFQMVSYCPETNEYIPEDKVPIGTKTLSISGTQLREMLRQGETVPDWFSYPEVATILKKAYL